VWNAGKLKWVKQPCWRKDADGMSWLGINGLDRADDIAGYANSFLAAVKVASTAASSTAPLA
jgi:hypothetical protein